MRISLDPYKVYINSLLYLHTANIFSTVLFYTFHSSNYCSSILFANHHQYLASWSRFQPLCWQFLPPSPSQPQPLTLSWLARPIATLLAPSQTYIFSSSIFHCDTGIHNFQPSDADECINQLAALNSVCNTDYGGRLLRKCGKAQIWSIARTSKGASTPW